MNTLASGWQALAACPYALTLLLGWMGCALLWAMGLRWWASAAVCAALAGMGATLGWTLDLPRVTNRLFGLVAIGGALGLLAERLPPRTTAPPMAVLMVPALLGVLWALGPVPMALPGMAYAAILLWLIARSGTARAETLAATALVSAMAAWWGGSAVLTELGLVLAVSALAAATFRWLAASASPGMDLVLGLGFPLAVLAPMTVRYAYLPAETMVLLLMAPLVCRVPPPGVLQPPLRRLWPAAMALTSVPAVMLLLFLRHGTP